MVSLWPYPLPSFGAPNPFQLYGNWEDRERRNFRVPKVAKFIPSLNICYRTLSATDICLCLLQICLNIEMTLTKEKNHGDKFAVIMSRLEWTGLSTQPSSACDSR